MSAGRVEAFSDGVIAIIITIMVLELHIPADASFKSLLANVPLLLVYALSFLTVAIMWVNHHHYLKHARRVDPSLLWANNTVLFWMSLIPFATRYLGQNLRAPLPITVYAGVLVLCCVSFYWLISVLCNHNRNDPVVWAEFERQRKKSGLTTFAYLACVGLARVWPDLTLVVIVGLPLLYFIPDRNLVEKAPGDT
jgi:uncharacterized membrane protein